MAVQKFRWYLKAQLGVLMLPAGLCLFGEAVIRKGIQTLAASAKTVDPIADPGPWFWYGTFGLILINAGIGLMIESGLLRGYPRRSSNT
jgi:hypothetical protein